MAKRIRITLVVSGINRQERHKRTIKALGLTKLGKTVVRPDNLAVRGMIRAVSHLVAVRAAD
jgi:large subunit ribosomal protein L30